MNYSMHTIKERPGFVILQEGDKTVIDHTPQVPKYLDVHEKQKPIGVAKLCLKAVLIPEVVAD